MTGDRPAASGFTPAPTGFVFRSQTRPSTPTESSSLRRPIRGRLCYGLVVLVALLSTPDCSDAVTVRYRTVHHRTEADFHRPIPSPSQAHERDRLGRSRRRRAEDQFSVSAASSAGFPACGFAELSSSAMFSAVKTGDWKVPRTRRQDCLRYGAEQVPRRTAPRPDFSVYLSARTV